MRETEPADSTGFNPVRFAFECIRKDRIPVAIVAAVAGILAFVGASKAPEAASTAQLVLTGIPVYAENQDEVEDIPTKVLAEPMDVKSATLLCTGDEASRRTREALGGEQAGSLSDLRGALRCEFSIAEESPMQIVYSPILKLTARAATPAEAKRRVDTWAVVCVELSKEFRAKRQGAIAEAFQRALDEFEGTYGRLEGPIPSEHKYRAYEELFTRAVFARVGADGNLAELQLLSAGAEWPAARPGTPLKTAAAGVVLGILAATACSLTFRFGTRPPAGTS